MSTCPRCSHTVGFAEKVSWASNSYHTMCFRCTFCDTRISQGREKDARGKLCCESCYNKKFAPRGFGYGGAVSGNYGEAEEQGGGGSSRRWTPSVTSAGSSTSQLNLPQSDRCARCTQPVYPAEKLTWSGQVFHKTCFKCNSCKRTLTRGQELDHGGKPYCASCHGKRFGPKGYGYGVGAGIMQGVYDGSSSGDVDESPSYKRSSATRKASSTRNTAAVPPRRASGARVPLAPTEQPRRRSSRKSSSVYDDNDDDVLSEASFASAANSSRRRSSRRSSKRSSQRKRNEPPAFVWPEISWESITGLLNLENFDAQEWIDWAKELVGLAPAK